MENQKLKSFSFTFTIPSFKKVYWRSKRKSYFTLSPNQQYHFLEDLMMKIINPVNFCYIDWVYEKHEDGRLHIHGYVITTPSNDDKVYLLRDSFYSYNKKVNIKMSSYLKISDIQQTYLSIDHWLSYIQKHQNDIAFKNGYINEKDLTKALDNGVVNIQTIPEDYYDTYRFGQTRKFTVEI